MKTEDVIKNVDEIYYSGRFLNSNFILPITGDIIKEILELLKTIDINFECNVYRFNEFYLDNKYYNGNVLNSIQYLQGFPKVFDIFFRHLETNEIIPNNEVKNIPDYETKIGMYIKISDVYKRDNLL